MNFSTFPSLRLFVYGALSCLDLALTYQLIQKGGGYIYESNPVANEWYLRYGWAGLACFKLLAVSIAAFSVVLVSVYRPRVGSLLLNFALAVVSGVVLYSFSLSNLVGESLNNTEIAPSRASADEFPYPAWGRDRSPADERLVQRPLLPQRHGHVLAENSSED